MPLKFTISEDGSAVMALPWVVYRRTNNPKAPLCFFGLEEDAASWYTSEARAKRALALARAVRGHEGDWRIGRVAMGWSVSS